MSGTTYYQRNKKVILNRAKTILKITRKYEERAENKYKELSEEEKEIKKKIWKGQM